MVDKTVLPSGVRVVTERTPHLPSFSLGFWFFVGSRDEGPGEEGITHFIEHMVFKGTKTRSSYQLSREIDKRGGILNGFTSREFTCFYVKLLKDFLDVGMDILSDISQNPSFLEKEMEKEKVVVLHEIKSSLETPDDRVFDLFYEGYWKGSSLAHPILGSYESIKNMSREKLFSYFRRAFSPGNMVVSLSGDVGHDEVLEAFSRFWKREGNGAKKENGFKVSPGIYVEERPVEQIHVVLGFEAFSARDDRRYPLYLLNTHLGSGMSSVLFQRIRERLGVAYSICSFYQPYTNTGLFGIYFATSKNHLEKAISEVGGALGDAVRRGMSHEELREAKDQTKGHIVIALESSENRMGRLAKNEFIYGREISVEETIEALDGVSLEQVINTAKKVLVPEKLGMALLGPISGVKVEDLLDCLKSSLKG